MFQKINVRVAGLLLITFHLMSGSPSAAQDKEDGSGGSVYGQIVMIREDGKERQIPVNKSIRVRLENGEVYNGKYEIVSDTSIAVDRRIIRIADIRKISGFNGFALLSPVLIGAGSYSAGFGAVAAVWGLGFIVVGYGPLLFAGGVALIALGIPAIALGIYILHHSKTFRIGRKWQIEVTKWSPAVTES